MLRRRSILFLLGLTACGPWQRVGSAPPKPEGPAEAGQFLDPAAVYRSLGFVTGTGQIPFVGGARLLGTGDADTAIAVIALSMQNRSFVFQRDTAGYAAAYRVELAFRQDTTLVRQVVKDERVVVARYGETQRADQSVAFQDFVPVAAGTYRLAIVVRDRNGPNVGRYESAFTVPALRPPALSTPIPVYRASPRTDLQAMPDLVADPSSTVDFGTDSLRFYVEGYSLPAASAVVATVLDSTRNVGGADTMRVAGAGALDPMVLAVAARVLSLGRHELRVGLAGGDVVATAPFLVALSGGWIVSSWSEMLSLLRYFTAADTLQALARTPPAERPAAWRKFYRDSDPDRATPQNESLEAYFARMRTANELFRDEGVPGWLTDRGEVYITLGAPSQMLDERPDYHGRGRTLVWIYDQPHLELYFVDESGFGRLRLSTGSRSDFEQLVNRLRRES